MASGKIVDGRQKPVEEKVQARTDKLRPKNPEDLRSSIEAINQMNRFVPNLANLCASLRPLLRKDKEFKYGDKEEETFLKIISKP